MFDTALQLALLLKRLEAQYKAASADGTVDRDEIVDLVIAFLAGLVDILSSVLPMELIDSAFDNVGAIRERAAAYRGKGASALDRAAEAYDEILK